MNTSTVFYLEGMIAAVASALTVEHYLGLAVFFGLFSLSFFMIAAVQLAAEDLEKK